MGPPRGPSTISKIPWSCFYGLYCEYHEGKTSALSHVFQNKHRSPYLFLPSIFLTSSLHHPTPILRCGCRSHARIRAQWAGLDLYPFAQSTSGCVFMGFKCLLFFLSPVYFHPSPTPYTWLGHKASFARPHHYAKDCGLLFLVFCVYFISDLLSPMSLFS